MKLQWKGKLTEHNSFTYSELPQNAKPLLDGASSWKMYLGVIPILVLAYVGIKIKLHLVEGVIFARWPLLIGIGLALVFVVVHELIHAICCPKDATIWIYWTSAGIAAVPTCPLTKRRYIFVALMPTLILGIVPFIVWLLLPGLNVTLSSIFFTFSIGSMGMCVSDVYNGILATQKMPAGSVLITSDNNCFFFEQVN